MKSIKIRFVILLVIVVAGNAHSQLWKQYADSATAFRDQKKMDKAIEYYYKAKEELQKDSMQTASYARNNTSLGNLFLNIGQYAKAEPLYLESKQIREKVLGKEHPDYASSCNNLANLYTYMGQYAKAEPYYLEAIQLYGKILGKDHPDYAGSCDNLSVLYRVMGQYEKAESYCVEGKNIREMKFGKEHSAYAKSCNNLAKLYSDMGRYDRAEPLYLESKQIRERSLGKEHPDFATSCDNLAVLYSLMGAYGKAEPLYIEAKNIREKVYGKNHPDYGVSCNNLAILYRFMGQYEKAEPLYLEAKQIKEKALGKEHPYYASSCNNLAVLYWTMGQYEKAELLFTEAKNITEKVLGKDHPEYASICVNLAGLYWNMGEFEKVGTLYIEAKQIRERVLGKEHPSYAGSCSDLARLYWDIAQYEKADAFYTEAKEIRGRTLGKDHPLYAETCNNLAGLYTYLSQYEKAEAFYGEAKQIRERVLGKDHHDYASSCKELATLYRNMGQYEKAEALYTEALQLQRVQIQKIFQFTSETEKQSYLTESVANNSVFFSFSFLDYSANPQGFAYDMSLSNRNIVLTSLQQLRSNIYNASDTSTMNIYSSWMNEKAQLAFWYAKPIVKRPTYIKNMEEKANVLEKQLTRLSSDFNKEQLKYEISWKNVQQNLKTNEAAVEFVEFQYFDGKRWTDSTYYIALILRKDKPEPELVSLFEKKQLDSILGYGKTSPGHQKLNDLYSVRANVVSGKSFKTLYNLIWQPLEPKLDGIQTIYFAPAGVLYKISFAALPVSKTEVLSDKYHLIQLNTTAAVTDKTTTPVTATDKILLYGGIQYDADSTSIKHAAMQYSGNYLAVRSVPEDLLREGVHEFSYLPGSESEVDKIGGLARQQKFNATMLKGINATEESVKTLSGINSPAVLHIATHGFFFPDSKNNPKDERRGGAIVFRQSDNPLIRSGLAVAGANNAWKGKPVTGVEDGILTSYEVSNMYLPNTKLAVLSACETGLGDIQGSEGVYGLQRALKMAGVQNLVMSLWRVDDKAASEFMLEFYKNLFAKQTISDAFYNAQTIMKNRYRNDPYKWAAWILVR